ncbi:hypothetical protein GCM10022207_58020 [Streptomyces lannensis]|uniref:Uncharacterized protein n=1 Tax=Streptomyces lannensis TaxID=766498 RepID=A0ABP7KNZ9_9ACTN
MFLSGGSAAYGVRSGVDLSLRSTGRGGEDSGNRCSGGLRKPVRMTAEFMAITLVGSLCWL